MLARFYFLQLREPDGSGRKWKSAEMIANGIPYKNIRGRRYYQLVSNPNDLYNVPEGWTRSDLIQWAPSRYDAFYFEEQFTALIPHKGKKAHSRYMETCRCIKAYMGDPATHWIAPLPPV